MVTKRIKINDTKTEFLFCGFPPTVEQGPAWISHWRGFLKSSLFPASEISGHSWQDSTVMMMSIHVSKVCSKAFRGLYSIRKFRKYLSGDATKVLVHAFVKSLLDYFNSDPYPLAFQNTNMIRLQRILSAAARIVFFEPKFSHHTPALHNLHWLPLPYRIQLKILLPAEKKSNSLIGSFFVGFFLFFYAVPCRD